MTTLPPVDDALARAAVAWPGVHVDGTRFAEFVAGRAADDLRADLVLACACLDGQPPALALFEERLLAPVTARLRATFGDAVGEETIGRLREALFLGPSAKLASYSGRGDLRGWLEVVATREAYKVLRKEPTATRGDEHILASLPDDDDLELRHMKEQHRSELRRAFAEALASLPPRERLLLRQRYLDSLTFDEVASLHGVHRITAMRWFARIEKTLLRDIRRILVARLGLETAELEHLVDDARSRLDISLRGLLATAVACILASASVAHADKATSLEHYNKGKRAYAAASFELAITEFELAYRAHPAPEYLHDIGQAHRRLGRPCDALAHFERYLAAKPTAKNKAEVEQLVATLRPGCAPAPATTAPQTSTTTTTPAATPSAPGPSQSPSPSPAASTVGAPARVAVATPAASTAISTAASPSREASPYSATASAGVVLLDAGPVVMPPVAQLELGVRRRLAAAYDLHAGAGLALARLPYDDMASGTVWLVGPQLAVDAAFPLGSRLSLVGGAAVGATAITGLGEGNPFVDGGMATGAIITARVRGELGIAWRASPRLAVRVVPVAYQWSPARGKLADDISALHGFAMAAGVAVGW